MVGERQEVARHQQPAARMRPAHQRLHAVYLARRDLGLRLVVQDQLAARPARRAARPAARAGGANGGRARGGRPRGRCASAWPRTWRRRRAGAARARRRRARGRARCRCWRRCARGCRRRRTSARARRAAAGRWPTRSPRRRGRARPRTRRRRAARAWRRARSASTSRGPIWRSTSSPAECPSVSLSSLKPSRSISSSATSPSLSLSASASRLSRWRRLPRPVRSSVIASRSRGAQAVDDRQPGARHPGQDGDRRQRRGDRREADELPDDEQRQRRRGVGEDRGQHDRAELRGGRGLGLGEPQGGDQERDRQQRQLAQRGEPGEGAGERERDPPAGEPERGGDADRGQVGGQLRPRGDRQRPHGAGAHRGVQPGHRLRPAEPLEDHQRRAGEHEADGDVVEALHGPELVGGARGQGGSEQHARDAAVVPESTAETTQTRLAATSTPATIRSYPSSTGAAWPTDRITA